MVGATATERRAVLDDALSVLAVSPGAGAPRLAAAAADHAGAEIGPQPAASGSESASVAHVLTCRVCGRPLEDLGAGQVPRELHPECKAFLNFLSATERAVRKVRFAEGGGHRRRFRASLLRVANIVLPVRWQRPRDAQGRFIREGVDEPLLPPGIVAGAEAPYLDRFEHACREGRR